MIGCISSITSLLEENTVEDNLLSLPSEMFSNIAFHLNSQDTQSFRLTHSSMRGAVFTQHLSLRPSLSAIESWIEHNDSQSVNPGIEWLRRDTVKLPENITDQQLEQLIDKGLLNSFRSLDLSGCHQ